MKRIFLILLTIIILTSCKVCDPVKWEQKTKFRSNRSYGVKLLETGTISKALEPKRATLVSVTRSMKHGFKHLFVKDNGDTVVIGNFQWLKVKGTRQRVKEGECYEIQDI